MTIKVAIVGAGNVGTTLGKVIARKHPVIYGVRDTAKYADLNKWENSSVLPVRDAIKASEVVILAVPGAHDDAGIRAIAASLGPEVQGKVLLDAVNPVSPYPGLEVRWSGKSGGEVLAEALPGTSVFKAFNTVGSNLMDQAGSPGLGGGGGGGGSLMMLFAGGPAGRELAEGVITATGFVPAYIGPIRYARNLEALAELWIHLAVPGVGTSEKWGREFHFQVIRKQQ